LKLLIFHGYISLPKGSKGYGGESRHVGMFWQQVRVSLSFNTWPIAVTEGSHQDTTLVTKAVDLGGLEVQEARGRRVAG